MSLLRSCLLAAAALPLSAPLAAQTSTSPQPAPHSVHYIEREFSMPVPGSGSAGLDVLEVYVDTPGAHPLALLTHGTSNIAAERMQLTPWAQLPQALWFAQRGYVSLVIIRQGYGRSGGTPDSVNGGCRPGGSFERSGIASANDLRAAVDYAKGHLPEADTSTVISAGVSTGGFAQVALTAHPPAGLKAAISFAGGRGGDGKGDLCNENNLLDAFQSFGKHAHTPMLWIYAENDKWFPPAYAKQFEQAYQHSGGTDQFVLAPPNGDDGHHLYAHVSAWSPTVEAFLADHHLLPITTPYPPPTPPDVAPPTGLHERGLDAFKTFLILGPYKAFATNGTGVYGFAAGQFTQQLADDRALTNCEKALRQGPPCRIVARTASRAAQ